MKTQSAYTEGWDAAYRENPGRSLWDEEPMPIVEAIADRAKELGLHSGVDLGCGDGRNLLALRQRGLEMAGLDLSPTALERARALLNAYGDAAPLIEGNVVELPLAGASAQLITALDVGGQIPDPALLLAEAHRVLCGGGLLVVNLFALEDETYGSGEKVAAHTFLYKQTMFRYFDEEEVRDLFASGWDFEIEKRSWTDGPHGEFRPEPHVHVNHVVWARRR